MALSINALATVEELQDYLNVYPESTDMMEIYIDAASGIIREHLGYNPMETTYTLETFIGGGLNDLSLSVRNLSSITDIRIAGDTQDITNVTTHDWYINSPDYAFTEDAIVLVSYVAGWSRVTMPHLIKLTCLRIAGILSSEGENNVGVTSKSYDDGSRTFITRKFDIYLEVIDSYQRYM